MEEELENPLLIIILYNSNSRSRRLLAYSQMDNKYISKLRW